MPTWKGSFAEASQNNAFFNTRNFLRGFIYSFWKQKDLPSVIFLFKETGEHPEKIQAVLISQNAKISCHYQDAGHQ
jgi:hypothetical protein